MNILTISGSSRAASANTQLLKALPALAPQHQFKYSDDIHQLPLFSAASDRAPWPAPVLHWRQQVRATDAVIIATPEYIHNLPASIKNALEWLTSSGELVDKKVLPITFTPHEPRGEKAMQSLLWSLQALDAQIVGQLPLYQNEVIFDSPGSLAETGAREMLVMGIELLGEEGIRS